MKALRSNQGFTLAYTLLFLLMVTSSVAVLMVTVTNGFTSANRVADLKRAYYVADAGVADAFIQLRGDPNPSSSFNVNNPNYAVDNGQTGSYAVTVEGTQQAGYTITAVGTYHGATKTLALRVKAVAMSFYAYLSNSEHHPVYGNLWWITGMTAVGPVRTNGQLNIWGDPIFAGTVMQAASGINYWNGGPPHDNPDFVDGITFNAPTIPFPTTTMLGNISSAASSSGMLLTGDSTIIFNSNGTMNVTNVAKGWNNQNMTMPSSGAVYVEDGSATVRGTVSGQVTVGSDREVYISGNLLYNTDPRTHPESTDLLALVARNNVTVTAASAPTNLELDAVLVALTGSFQVDQWWVAGKGNMIQYGSLINNYCGPTGVFDPSTGILSGGYNQLQYYDARLQTMIPPIFPPAVDSNGDTLYTKVGFNQL